MNRPDEDMTVIDYEVQDGVITVILESSELELAEEAFWIWLKESGKCDEIEGEAIIHGIGAVDFVRPELNCIDAYYMYATNEEVVSDLNEYYSQ